MALTAQQSNYITRLMGRSLDQRGMQTGIKDDLAEWYANDMINALVDEDITAAFPHLTKAEVIGCITALAAVDTALGDPPSGQVVNLIKMRG